MQKLYMWSSPLDVRGVANKALPALATFDDRRELQRGQIVE